LTKIRALLNDDRRGATAIFKDALTLFAGYKSVAQIHSEAEQLKERFPVMGVFRNFHRQIQNLASLSRIQERIAYFQTRLEQDFDRVVAKAAARLAPQSHLMTISHSSYVRELILRCREKELTVYCLRSGPGNEGEDLAKRLVQQKVKTILVEDDQAQSRLEAVDLVVVGCDLLSEQFFINKRGTKKLVEAAIEETKQVWILADPLRFIPEIELEELPELFEKIPLRPEYQVFW
jgi:translation initiation factor 2B subunit (eIF-2B alpha/beta/delta family)